MSIPTSQRSNVRRVRFKVPVGTPIELDLWVEASPAIAHPTLTQFVPSPAWSRAFEIKNTDFVSGSGHVHKQFTPPNTGIYRFDWQFYLSGPNYRICVRLVSSGVVQYRRYIAAGAQPDFNPYGMVGIILV